MPAQPTINTLRQKKRQQRSLLSASEQTQHARLLAEQLLTLPVFTHSRRIAAYLSNDSEINPVHIIEQAWKLNKQVYLPVLSAHENSLLFSPYEKDSQMRKNQFGIDEPVCQPEHQLKAERLDLILLPLVAFDDQGNRLGMGGGFYDRSLANVRQNTRPIRLIGLAHEIQKTSQLEVQSWDVPLDAVVTESKFYDFGAKV